MSQITKFCNPYVGENGIVYPERPQFYGMKFLRALFESGAAGTLPPQSVALLTYIVWLEDSTRYCRPVSLWNSQLDRIFGFKSAKSIIRARQAAIDSGWLVFSRDSRRTVGQYCVAIPADIASAFIFPNGNITGEINDSPPEVLSSQKGSPTGSLNPLLSSQKGSPTGSSSNLSLIKPNPIKKRTTNPEGAKSEKPPSKKQPKAVGDIDPPPGIDPQVWADWICVRKAKRAGPVTKTVAAAIQREAAKAGITVCEAIAIAAERGWQGFRADWSWQESRRQGGSIHDIPTLQPPKRRSDGV